MRATMLPNSVLSDLVRCNTMKTLQTRAYLIGVVAFLSLVLLSILQAKFGFASYSNPREPEYTIIKTWFSTLMWMIVTIVGLPGIGALISLISGRNRSWLAWLSALSVVLIVAFFMYAAHLADE